MCGIVSGKKSKPLALFCNPDHTHILIGLHPSVAISDMVRDRKANSSKWINEKRWIIGKFNWQEGFGTFTYSKSQISTVVRYILNQSEHHKKTSFKDEYIDLLEKFEVAYDEKYLFKWNE